MLHGVCNNLTLLFLLSFTICSALFPLSLNHHSSLFIPRNGHTVAHHTTPVPFRLSTTTPLCSLLSLCSSPLCLSVSLSLSVMAYQDGFYGAADLYVSIPLSSPLSHSSPMFSTLLPVGFSSVKWQRPNPLESCIFGYFDSSHYGVISCQSPPKTCPLSRCTQSKVFDVQ